jgi:hypothetical protein
MVLEVFLGRTEEQNIGRGGVYFESKYSRMECYVQAEARSRKQ